MANRIFFVANWKMYLSDPEEAKSLFSEYVRLARKNTKLFVGVAPSAVHLEALAKRGRPRNLFMGAQDASLYQEGAHTGLTSMNQLREAGASFVVLGHSERRAEGETNAEVSQKIKLAIKSGLAPIVCVGEKERDSSGDYFTELRKEIKETFAGLTRSQFARTTVAYEPVWAVGEKAHRAMTPAELYQTIIFIRKVLSDIFGLSAAKAMRLLYGGSVDKNNVKDLVSLGGAQGFLAGRASIKPQEFSPIVRALNEIKLS